MLYRFHYQGILGREVSPKPEIQPEYWHKKRNTFIAIAYVEAINLDKAYERLSGAVTWWNEQAKVETVIDKFDDMCFIYDGVEFFRGSHLCQRLAPSQSEG